MLPGPGLLGEWTAEAACGAAPGTPGGDQGRVPPMLSLPLQRPGHGQVLSEASMEATECQSN